MDQNSIPACALYRNTGTVIVRLRMEVDTSCCTGCPPSGCPEVLHRPSGCEQCNRTRFISKYSDCDSGVVEKCRPYRSSAARSRYVNVCAAVCLLLLFGGLSPRSTATPLRRIMAKRAADTENPLWGNPCDYQEESPKPAPEEESKLASKLVAQANNIYSFTSEYKDTFALKLHSFSSFDTLLLTWKDEDWLRLFEWMPAEAFPKDKVLNQQMPAEYMQTVISKIKTDNSLLEAMCKGLKMVVAGLHWLLEEGLSPDSVPDVEMKPSINRTMQDVGAVLCYFTDILRARNQTILPLPDSEVPDLSPRRLVNGALVFRDTLNYLEYLIQVFQTLYNMSP